MVLPLWRSIFSVNLMLPKEERRAMLLRLYNDNSPLIDTSKGGRQKQVTAERQGKLEEEVSSSSSPEDASLDAEIEAEEEKARVEITRKNDGDNDDSTYVAPIVQPELAARGGTATATMKEKRGDDDKSIDGDAPLETGDVERHIETAQGAESSAIDERYDAERELKPAH